MLTQAERTCAIIQPHKLLKSSGFILPTWH